MKKRFIVLLASSTKGQDDSFLVYLKKEGFGYWHWFNDSWVLISHSGEHTSERIRDTIRICYPSVRNVVFEFSSDGRESWHGFGPGGKDGKPNMFDWMHKNWLD